MPLSARHSRARNAGEDRKNLQKTIPSDAMRCVLQYSNSDQIAISSYISINKC